MDPLDEALSFCLKGDFLASEKILKKLDQNNKKVSFNLGWHYLRQGDLKKGFEGLETGRDINVFGNSKPRGIPLYTGQDLKNKTVLFAGEGGLGDQIINIRFIKNIAELGAKIIVSCDPKLFSLFKEMPYVTALCHRDYDQSIFCDYFIPGMSAPLYLNLNYENIDGKPYLNYFTPRNLFPFNKTLKVGLKWSGNPAFEHEQYRKFPVKLMLDLLDMPDIVFYSLQKDEDFVDEDRFIDLRYELKTWKDTAEIIAGLDLVITSCTSVAHLAGALGKPVWIIVPILSYYIWSLPGNTSPWYDSAVLYRQEQYGDWAAPFQQIKQDLIKYKEHYTR